MRDTCEGFSVKNKKGDSNMSHKTIQGKINDLKKGPGCEKLDHLIQPLAIKLVLEATKHPDWDSFISFFVDDQNPVIKKKQLARLKLQDDKKDLVYIRRAVAYLLANSVCGCDTKSKLDHGIEDRLDRDINELTVPLVIERAEEYEEKMAAAKLKNK